MLSCSLRAQRLVERVVALVFALASVLLLVALVRVLLLIKEDSQLVAHGVV